MSLNFQKNELLSKHTYFRIGGPARYFVIPKSIDDLKCVSDFIREKKIPYVILGAGSNVLVSDNGFDGLVISTKLLNKEIEVDSSYQGNDTLRFILKIGASVLVSRVLNQSILKGWGGLSFLTGIPGSMGGVTFMNAGTHLGEIEKIIKKVRIFDLEARESLSDVRDFSSSELKYSYRKNSYLKPSMVVESIFLEVQEKDSGFVKSEIEEVLKRRKNSQPLEAPSCGSVFKNPRTDLRAWQVIDGLGLRGYQWGGAKFSEKHPNFILNFNEATAQDVKNLIDLAKKRAKEERGLVLEEEVRYIGF